MLALQLEPIDLSKHSARCVAFRRDTYLCGFGAQAEARFAQDNGPNGELYLPWLAGRLAGFPEGHVHAWYEGRIVGQLEMIAQQRDEPACGYVNLFYLVPEARGAGLGEPLHDYAVALALAYGAEKLRLSVSPSNTRALRYYAKHGWRSLGPSPGSEHLHLCELSLRSALREQG